MFRRQKLASARTKAVLDKVASLGQWGRSMAPGTAQGVAIHEEYKSVVAFLVEIDCRDRTSPRVTNGVCAVDVGRAINPRGLEAQMQGVLVDAALDDAAGGAAHRLRRGAGGQLLRLPVRAHGQQPAAYQRECDPRRASRAAPASSVSRRRAAVANAYARATGTAVRRFPIAG